LDFLFEISARTLPARLHDRFRKTDAVSDVAGGDRAQGFVAAEDKARTTAERNIYAIQE
jgi:hypothetical protein